MSVEIGTTDVRLQFDGGEVGGYFASPLVCNGAALLLIHEWWGLNADIRAIAQRLARLGFAVIAVDLFDGRSTDNPDVAATLMNQMEVDRSKEVLLRWIDWLCDEKGYRRIGAIGFCLGGHWALRVATFSRLDAVVVYYGSVGLPADALVAVTAPVLGHFGLHDPVVPIAEVSAFDRAMRSLAKPVDVRIYGADHAFARVDGPNYDAGLAEAAWDTTARFLAESLTGSDTL